MSQEWGRADGAGTWPRPKPVWTLALLLVAIVSGGAIGAYRYTTVWTPLQRLFLSRTSGAQMRERAGLQDRAVPPPAGRRSQRQPAAA